MLDHPGTNFREFGGSKNFKKKFSNFFFLDPPSRGVIRNQNHSLHSLHFMKNLENPSEFKRNSAELAKTLTILTVFRKSIRCIRSIRCTLLRP